MASFLLPQGKGQVCTSPFSLPTKSILRKFWASHRSSPSTQKIASHKYSSVLYVVRNKNVRTCFHLANVFLILSHRYVIEKSKKTEHATHWQHNVVLLFRMGAFHPMLTCTIHLNDGELLWIKFPSEKHYVLAVNVIYIILVMVNTFYYIVLLVVKMVDEWYFI